MPTPTVWEDARIFIGGCDASGQSNQISVEASGEVKDYTNWTSGGWKENRTGLLSAKLAASGFLAMGAAGTVEYDSWSRLGKIDAWTIGPDGAAAVGALAYLTQTARLKYPIGDKVGELAPWSTEGSSSWPMARGAFLHDPGTARAHDGNGTAVQLGAMTADQRLYAAVHWLSLTGAAPTVDLTIQSDSVEAFTGSPETRLTFTQATGVIGVTGEIIRTAAGAHADTWYRAVWNISEVGDESILFVVSAGIL